MGAPQSPGSRGIGFVIFLVACASQSGLVRDALEHEHGWGPPASLGGGWSLQWELGVRRAENLAKRGETEGPGSRGWGGSGFGRRGWGGAPGSQARVRDLARSSERTRGPLPARGPAGRSSQRVSRSILTARSPPLRSRGPRGAARGVNSGPQKQVHMEAMRRESWTLSTWDAARPPAHHRVLEEGTSLFGKK